MFSRTSLAALWDILSTSYFLTTGIISMNFSIWREDREHHGGIHTVSTTLPSLKCCERRMHQFLHDGRLFRHHTPDPPHSQKRCIAKNVKVTHTPLTNGGVIILIIRIFSLLSVRRSRALRCWRWIVIWHMMALWWYHMMRICWGRLAMMSQSPRSICR